MSDKRLSDIGTEDGKAEDERDLKAEDERDLKAEDERDLKAEDERDLNDLTHAELVRLAQGPPLDVRMSPFLAFMVIGQIQLALRHPANTGAQRVFVTQFIRDLRGRLTRPGSPVDTMIGMGDDPRFDRIVEDGPVTGAQGEALLSLAAAVGQWDAADTWGRAEAERLLHNAYVGWCETARQGVRE